MSDQQQPAFPPEIEQIIFRLAVQLDWTTAKSLIFVANRVHHWYLISITMILLSNIILTEGDPRDLRSRDFP